MQDGTHSGEQLSSEGWNRRGARPAKRMIDSERLAGLVPCRGRTATTELLGGCLLRLDGVVEVGALAVVIDCDAVAGDVDAEVVPRAVVVPGEFPLSNV